MDGGLCVFRVGKELGVAIVWDETRIAALTNVDLLQLLENAVSLQNALVKDLCEREIARRPASVKSKRSRSATSPDPLRNRETELSAELGAFASGLAKKYDLSADTAREKSKGILRFQPHQLTQSNGTAKLGGLQRAGKCKIDRYISYRLRDRVISLNVYLAKDVEDNALEFQVFAPKELLPNGSDMKIFRPGLEGEKESKLYPWGQRFDDLQQAKRAFESVIAQFVTN